MAFRSPQQVQTPSRDFLHYVQTGRSGDTEVRSAEKQPAAAVARRPPHLDQVRRNLPAVDQTDAQGGRERDYHQGGRPRDGIQNFEESRLRRHVSDGAEVP